MGEIIREETKRPESRSKFYSTCMEAIVGGDYVEVDKKTGN